MVKLTWYYSTWLPQSRCTILQWITENLGERTVQNMDPEDGDDEDEFDHHYYEGNDRWQYHYVRTTLMPSEQDRHLYRTHLNKKDELYYMAAYFEVPDDATAVMMRLALSENQ